MNRTRKFPLILLTAMLIGIGLCVGLAQLISVNYSLLFAVDNLTLVFIVRYITF